MLVAKENVMLVLQQPQVRELVERARARGNNEYAFVDLVAKLELGEFQLWLLHEETKLKLIMITGIELWPRTKYLRVEMLSGEDFDEYLPHLPELLAWAKTHKCKELVAQVRPGFVKKLEPFGAQVMGVNIRMPVEAQNVSA